MSRINGTFRDGTDLSGLAEQARQKGLAARKISLNSVAQKGNILKLGDVSETVRKAVLDKPRAAARSAAS